MPARFVTERIRKSTWVADYEYVSHDGVVRYVVERHENGSRKWFSMARKASQGWYVGEGAMEGVQRVPYRLDRINANRPVLGRGESAILFVEGEKCVDAAEAWLGQGYVATTLAGGAKASVPADLAEQFSGIARAVVLADNDDVGRAWARAVAQRLAEAVPDVRLLGCLPGLEGHAKADLVDFIALGKKPQDFPEAIERNAERVAPPDAGQPHPRSDDAGERSRGFSPAFVKSFPEVAARGDLTHAQRDVYMVIRSFVEFPRRSAWRWGLSTKRIGDLSGYNRTTVSLAVRGLEVKGFIEVEHSTGGRQRTNDYRMLPVPSESQTVAHCNSFDPKGGSLKLLRRATRRVARSNTHSSIRSRLDVVDEIEKAGLLKKPIPEAARPEQLDQGVDFSDQQGSRSAELDVDALKSGLSVLTAHVARLAREVELMRHTTDEEREAGSKRV